jgi:hypothetical protein
MDLQINIRKNITYLNSTIVAEALLYITLKQDVFHFEKVFLINRMAARKEFDRLDVF